VPGDDAGKPVEGLPPYMRGQHLCRVAHGSAWVSPVVLATV